MATAYATKLAEGYSTKLLKEMYDQSLTDMIVNREYEGEINGVGSVLNIFALDRIAEQDYTGANLNPADLYEKNAQLVIEKKKSFYPRIYTIDQWYSYFKNLKSAVMQQMAGERNRNMDIYVLGKYDDVAAGNRIGTDYTTGTLTGSSAGVVTGSGTTFTSSMVGKPFKAMGHTQWYRVASFSSTTSITIEDDLDDVDSQYTGGAISAGTAYTIQANTAVTLSASNLLTYVSRAKRMLDIAQRDNKSRVPNFGRWMIVPAEFEELLPTATGVALNVPAVYEDLVKKGFLTELQGFKIFKSNDLAGDATNGFHILAGHSNWMTFADKLLQARMEEDLDGNFGAAYKDLFVYGGKVPDTRRHMAVDLFAKF